MQRSTALVFACCAAFALACGGFGPTTHNPDLWDGTQTLKCYGFESLTVKDRVVVSTVDPAISASGNCTLTLENVDVTGGNVLDTSGNAVVTVKGGALRGTAKAVSTGAMSAVTLDGVFVTGELEHIGSSVLTNTNPATTAPSTSTPAADAAAAPAAAAAATPAPAAAAPKPKPKPKGPSCWEIKAACDKKQLEKDYSCRGNCPSDASNSSCKEACDNTLKSDYSRCDDDNRKCG